MKINSQKHYIFAALIVILIGAATAFGQVQEPIAGGYGSADVNDAAVVKAANFAVKKQAKVLKAKIKLVSIAKAEQQVVAGLNYSLCMLVEVLEKGKKTAVPQTVQTVVFRDLNDKYSVTSWAIAACADAVPPVKPVE